MASKNSAFQTITNNSNNMGNIRQTFKQFNDAKIDPTNVNTTGDQLRNSQYQILNSYDPVTLNNMSSNAINFSTNLSDPVDYSSFVSHRDPSLNVGMKALPIQNMTSYNNQLMSSIDLLAQTDQLTISNMNKKITSLMIALYYCEKYLSIC